MTAHHPLITFSGFFQRSGIQLGFICSQLQFLVHQVPHQVRQLFAVRVSAAIDESKVHVTVSDDGTGIAAGDLPHIFDRFYKSADSRGSGLGLAIAKSLVEAQGGTIEARSDSGKGTAVEFTLPTSTV